MIIKRIGNRAWAAEQTTNGAVSLPNLSHLMTWMMELYNQPDVRQALNASDCPEKMKAFVRDMKTRVPEDLQMVEILAAVLNQAFHDALTMETPILPGEYMGFISGLLLMVIRLAGWGADITWETNEEEFPDPSNSTVN